MTTIPHRELRNQSSKILERVKNGETIDVTNNGEVAATLIPPSASPFERLLLSGQVRPAAEGAGRAAGVVFDVSGSIGVTELDPADEVSDTIRQADVALRAAKSDDPVTAFQPIRPEETWSSEAICRASR